MSTELGREEKVGGVSTELGREEGVGGVSTGWGREEGDREGVRVGE